MSIHTVTVHEVPNMHLDLPDEQYIDTVKYTVDECPASGCIVWWECVPCRDRDVTEEEDDDGEFTAHGVFHQNIDGMWMTESTSCAIDVSDSAQESMQDAATEAGVGTHKFDLQYEGDDYWSVTKIKEE